MSGAALHLIEHAGYFLPEFRISEATDQEIALLLEARFKVGFGDPVGAAEDRKVEEYQSRRVVDLVRDP